MLGAGSELEKSCGLFYGRERVKQRLVLYHGVRPIFMEFSEDAEETFSRALGILVVSVFIFIHFLFMLQSFLHVVKCLQTSDV